MVLSHHVTQRPRRGLVEVLALQRHPSSVPFHLWDLHPGPCSRHSHSSFLGVFAVCFMHQASIQDQRPVFHGLFLLTLRKHLAQGTVVGHAHCSASNGTIGGAEQGEGSRGCCDLSTVTHGQPSRRNYRLTNRRSQRLDNHPESRQEVRPAIARVGGLGESRGSSKSRKATWRRWYLGSF